MYTNISPAAGFMQYVLYHCCDRFQYCCIANGLSPQGVNFHEFMNGFTSHENLYWAASKVRLWV